MASAMRIGSSKVRMPACPGCSHGFGFPSSVIGVYCCAKCNGIVGSCYQGDAYRFYLPYWAEGDVPIERQQYVDLEILSGAKGIYRFHGWVDADSRKIVQVG